MKLQVIFVMLILISMPISFAKEVAISEIFEVEQTKDLDSTKEVYFYTGNNLVASLSDGLNYEHQDRLGSNINSKALPYGTPLNVEDRFSFSSKELDDKLYYFGARYYDPDLGRFSSVDPVETNHPYSYVDNNPMNRVDPSGAQDLAIQENKLYFTSEGTTTGRAVNTLSRGEFVYRDAAMINYASGSRSMPYVSIINGNQRALFLSTHGNPVGLQGISVSRTISAINRNPNIECVGVSACSSTQTAARINLFTGRPSLGYMGSFYGYDSTRDFGHLLEGGNRVFRYDRWGKPHIGMVFSSRGTSAAYLGLSGLAAAVGVVGTGFFAVDTIKAVAQAETAEEKAIEVTARASGLAVASQTAPMGAAIGAAQGTPLGPLGFLGGGLLGGLIGGSIGYFGGEVTGEVAGVGAMIQGQAFADAEGQDVYSFADWGGP